MSNYSVKSKLIHDGVEYVDGDSVEMSEKQAGPLIALNVLGKSESLPTESEKRLEAIVEIIIGMDTEDESLWTKEEGVPTMDALRDAADDKDITVEERDGALGLITEE